MASERKPAGFHGSGFLRFSGVSEVLCRILHSAPALIFTALPCLIDSGGVFSDFRFSMPLPVDAFSAGNGFFFWSPAMSGGGSFLFL